MTQVQILAKSPSGFANLASISQGHPFQSVIQSGARSLWHRPNDRPSLFRSIQHRNLRNWASPAATFEEQSTNMWKTIQRTFVEWQRQGTARGSFRHPPEVSSIANEHVLVLNSGDELDRHIQSSPGCVLLQFTATRCSPCKLFAPTYERIAADYMGRATLLSIDAMKNKHVRSRFGIKGVPSFYLFRNGKVVAKERGLSAERAMSELALRSHLDECVSSD